MHVSILDTTLAALLYITCAFVQGATLRNFWLEAEKKNVRVTAWFGFGMGIVSFFLIISDVIAVVFYPGRKVDEVSGAMSLAWSTLIMLPVTHYMVIKHQRMPKEEIQKQ